MKYCSTCGKQIEDEAIICIHCGCLTSNKVIEEDKNNPGFNVLAFLIPIVGMILYFAWKNEKPIRANGIGAAALGGFVCSIILMILLNL